LMTALLDEGAGELDSSAFRARLEEFGIEFGFSDSGSEVTGGMRTLVSEQETAFDMLRLALTSPRFDEEPIERIRNAIRLSLERAVTNPSSISRDRLRERVFPDHPYSKAPNGTLQTIGDLDRDDLATMHQRLFAKDNLVIGVVGAIGEAELAQALDDVFGDLPNKAQLNDIPEVVPVLGVSDEISVATPNASISLVYKGLKRDDPDFFAGHLMNHILGGGSFTSRLYEEVREKRGLSYGASSSMVSRPETAFLVAGTSTRAENRDEVIEIMRSAVSDIANGGITQEELEKAKRFTIGSYAINNLDTSRKIARVLVALQTEKLGIDYIDRREQLISNVTLEDVNRVAKRLLSVEPTMVVVAPATR
ncbi:MAG: pitrilysin family protein, partial [Pseudomonadota bacterium]